MGSRLLAKFTLTLALVVVAVTGHLIYQDTGNNRKTDPYPVMSASITNPRLTQLGTFYQNWLTRRYITYTEYDLASKEVWVKDSLSLSNDPTLPDFLVGYPMGYSISSSAYQIGFCTIPRTNPTIIQCRDYANHRWNLFGQEKISSNPFEKWSGIIGDGVTSDTNNRLFVYGPLRVTELGISYRDNNGSLDFISTYDLNSLAGNFLGFNMTAITGVTIILNTLYIARNGPNPALPSELMLFDLGTSPMTYNKTIYFHRALSNLVGWVQDFGPSLLWSTQDTPTQFSIFFWDLFSHTGGPITHISIPSNITANAWVTQYYGEYAVYGLSQCAGNTIPGLALFELRSSQIVRSLSDFRVFKESKGLNTQLPLGPPSIAVPIASSLGGSTGIRPGALFAVQTFSGGDPTNLFSSISFSEDPNFLPKFPKQPLRAQRSERATFDVPPFCSVQRCGPDLHVADCSSGKCLYYNPASSWVCCAKNPF